MNMIFSFSLLLFYTNKDILSMGKEADILSMFKVSFFMFNNSLFHKFIKCVKMFKYTLWPKESYMGIIFPNYHYSLLDTCIVCKTWKNKLSQRYFSSYSCYVSVITLSIVSGTKNVFLEPKKLFDYFIEALLFYTKT